MKPWVYRWLKKVDKAGLKSESHLGSSWARVSKPVLFTLQILRVGLGERAGSCRSHGPRNSRRNGTMGLRSQGARACVTSSPRKTKDP